MAIQAHEAVINIHPSAFIAPGAVVLGDVTLGPRSSVWYGAVLRGDVAAIVVGEATNLQDGTIVHVDAGKPARIGARVGVGHRAILHACTVEDDCLIGMGSVLLNDAHIGTGSVVAAGAIVPEGTRIPPGSLVLGVPARVTRPVDEALRERIRHTWQHYVAEAQRHRAGHFPLARPSL
ncbi:MAG TPA: gamma carbonic anhydrase family protein [Gemmatimonadales bacterium]|nr:gamma carbonic anhydrase family protein [Gemmatimonadales bacterium]